VPTFARGYWTRKTNLKNAELHQRVEREAGIQTTPGRIHWIVDAGDSRTLRGIPAIGRNVQGAIPGTRPDANIDRD